MQATTSTTERDFSIFHRNMEYALWLATLPGFVEGDEADEKEHQKLKQRKKRAGKVTSTYPHTQARREREGERERERKR